MGRERSGRMEKNEMKESRKMDGVRCDGGGGLRCMVEAQVLRRWLFLFFIFFFFLMEYLDVCVSSWIKPTSSEEARPDERKWEGRGEGEEHKLFHLSCLHCGYRRRAV